MNLIDSIALVFIGFFAIAGFFKGFFRQLMGFLGLVAAAFLSKGFAPYLGTYLKPHLPSDFLYGEFLILSLTAMGIFLLFSFTGGLVQQGLIHRFPLSKLANKGLGFLFGGAKGVLMVFLVGWVFQIIPTPADAKHQAYLQESALVRTMTSTNPFADPKWRKQFAHYRDWMSRESESLKGVSSKVIESTKKAIVKGQASLKKAHKKSGKKTEAQIQELEENLNEDAIKDVLRKQLDMDEAKKAAK